MSAVALALLGATSCGGDDGNEALAPADTTSTGEGVVGPEIGVDHWHGAFGVIVCGEWLPNPADTQGDALGIHTHEDGLIHIHPSSENAAGENATLQVFLDEIGYRFDGDLLVAGDEGTWRDGDACGSGEGGWSLWVDGEQVDEPPAQVHLEDGQTIVLSFADDDQAPPLPPSVSNLVLPTDVPGNEDLVAEEPFQFTGEGSGDKYTVWIGWSSGVPAPDWPCSDFPGAEGARIPVSVRVVRQDENNDIYPVDPVDLRIGIDSPGGGALLDPGRPCAATEDGLTLDGPYPITRGILWSGTSASSNPTISVSLDGAEPVTSDALEIGG